MIYVECKADKSLVHVIANIRPYEIEHCSGKNEVLKRLSKDKRSIGIIDEDPDAPSPTELKEFECKFKYRKSELSLKFYYEKSNNNLLIIICPNLENWIIEASKEEKINLNSYDLPSNPVDFHNIINPNITKFQNLLHGLLKRKNKRLLTLRECIENFIRNGNCPHLR
jgi:hypothetical protein